MRWTNETTETEPLLRYDRESRLSGGWYAATNQADRPWFLVRDTQGGMEYHTTPSGRLARFSSCLNAIRRAKRLNERS